MRSNRAGADKDHSCIGHAAAREPCREVGLELKMHLGGLGFDGGKRRLVRNRHSNHLRIAHFAEPKRVLRRDAKRNGNVTCSLCRYERTVVQPVPLFAARRDDWHLDDQDEGY
jgi:hypothetical protein